jgi:flagellar hook-basal body complex protein FliE
MDLRLLPISTSVLNRSSAAPKNLSVSGTGMEQGGFSTALKGALQSVSESQHQVDSLQKEVQMENPSVSLEETMIAIQKAQIGFQATVNVRNRMVQAYSDIMNMQV